MALKRVKEYPITRLNGINKLTLPEDSYIIGAVALQNTSDIVHVLVLEPAKIPVDYPKKEVALMVATAQTPFSDPDPGKVLEYIGSVVWDSGHRMQHIFEISDEIFDLPIVAAEPELPKN